MISLKKRMFESLGRFCPSVSLRDEILVQALRVSAPLRRAVGVSDVHSLVLTFHRGAIWGWTPADFERSVEQPVAAADPFNVEVMDFAHALLAPAQDVEIDRQGRIRIPAPLRELAGLGREVMINSLVNRLEIWDRQAWTTRFSESLDRARGFSGMPGGS